MTLQDRLERPTTLAPRQAGEARRERADAPPKDRDDDRQANGDDGEDSGHIGHWVGSPGTLGAAFSHAAQVAGG
jgi:hypothetical protein